MCVDLHVQNTIVHILKYIHPILRNSEYQDIHIQQAIIHTVDILIIVHSIYSSISHTM